MSQHVAERMIVAKTVGGLKFGSDQSLLANGDLATDLATAKAAVVTAGAATKRHVSERNWPIRVTKSLDQIGNFDSTYIGGSSVLKASMLALSNAKGIAPVF